MISFVSLVMVITNDDADAVVDDGDDDGSYHLKYTMVTTSVHRCLLVRGIFWAHSCFLRWVSIASQKPTNLQNVTIFVETNLILLLLPPLPPHALCDLVFWKYGSIRTQPQQLTLWEPACLSISKDEEAYPPYEILIFLMNFIFFRRNGIISWGKKHTAHFQTHNWEKSSFFQRARTCICTVNTVKWLFMGDPNRNMPTTRLS